MSDIVDRLRKDGESWAQGLFNTAADEIERLERMHQDMCRVAGHLGTENERLRAALKECGAPYLSPPTTVMGASAYVAEEFERRMNIAANTLNDAPMYRRQALAKVQAEMKCSHTLELGEPCDQSSGGWWSCGCAIIAQRADTVNGQEGNRTDG
jgi:hypothetical protein